MHLRMRVEERPQGFRLTFPRDSLGHGDLGQAFLLALLAASELAGKKKVQAGAIRHPDPMTAYAQRQAAQRIARDGLPGVSAVWMDGFFTFTDPELSVVRALKAHAPHIPELRRRLRERAEIVVKRVSETPNLTLAPPGGCEMCTTLPSRP